MDDPCEQPPSETNPPIDDKSESLHQSLPLEGGGPLAVEGVKNNRPPEPNRSVDDKGIILTLVGTGVLDGPRTIATQT